MKLTTKQLRKMIKEELAKEGAFDKVKGSLGMGPKKGSQEDVRAKIKNINILAVDLHAAVEAFARLAEETGDLQGAMDNTADQFGADASKAIDDMLRITQAAVEMSGPGSGKDGTTGQAMDKRFFDISTLMGEI
jgi:hypothetical protein